MAPVWHRKYGTVNYRWLIITLDLLGSCKGRLDALLEKLRKDDIDSLRKSGTEEELDEREDLLRNILDDMEAEALVCAAVGTTL